MVLDDGQGVEILLLLLLSLELLDEGLQVWRVL